MKNKKLTIELIKKMNFEDFYDLTYNIDFSKISKEILNYIVETKNMETLSILAKNPSTPAEFLEKLLEHKNESVQFLVAEHPNISDKAAKELSNHQRDYIRSTLAKNKSLSNELFTILSKDSKDYCFFVKLELIRNPNVPLDVLIPLLINLSNSEEEFVREEVAMHPLTPIDTLEQLFKDKERKVQINVLKNINTPINILIEAFETEDQLMRNTSKIHPKMSDFKILDNELIIKENKVKENKNHLESLMTSLNISEHSKVGINLLEVYNETQGKLNNEILKLKENIANLKEAIYLKQEETSITRD